MGKTKDLSNKRFGRLIAIRRVGTKHTYALWECVCDCGTRKQVTSRQLVAGLTKSCGCLGQETRTINGKKTRREDISGMVFGQ